MLGIFKHYKHVSLGKAKFAFLLLATKAVTASAQATSNSTNSSGGGFNPSTGNIIAVAVISAMGFAIVGGLCHFARTACNDQPDPADYDYEEQHQPVVQLAGASAKPSYHSLATPKAQSS